MTRQESVGIPRPSAVHFVSVPGPHLMLTLRVVCRTVRARPATGPLYLSSPTWPLQCPGSWAAPWDPWHLIASCLVTGCMATAHISPLAVSAVPSPPFTSGLALCCPDPSWAPDWVPPTAAGSHAGPSRVPRGRRLSSVGFCHCPVPAVGQHCRSVRWEAQLFAPQVCGLGQINQPLCAHQQHVTTGYLCEDFVRRGDMWGRSVLPTYREDTGGQGDPLLPTTLSVT